MPVRHEGDYQGKPIRSWDAWVDEAIQEAQERGEFDNLPQQGKPIRIEETPFAPDMAAALSTLKNAGYAPTWMELDREITQGKVEMAAFLARSTACLNERRVRLATQDGQEPEEPEPAVDGLWARFRRWLSFASEVEPATQRVLTFEDLVHIRLRMREQYLERAAAVDKKITAFHGALPRNLWHLERMRLSQETAARTFDEACPSLHQSTSSQCVHES